MLLQTGFAAERCSQIKVIDLVIGIQLINLVRWNVKSV